MLSGGMMRGVFLPCWEISWWTGGGMKVEDATDVFFLVRREVPSLRWRRDVGGGGLWLGGRLEGDRRRE